MATDDITRSLFTRSRRYGGVHMQQGRVLTDADFNAATDIALSDRRLTRLGVIGPYGSSDDGFRISNPTAAGGEIDFDIGSGTLYLGGHRIERLAPESFRLQTDWLNKSGVAAPGGAGTRFDLAYVTFTMQPVSAVEDGELMEPALGGPDTTTRLRPIARVDIATDVGTETCEEAWTVLRDRLSAAGFGNVDSEMRLIPDTRFTVSFSPGSGGDDLCSPEVIGGYLGAENRTIRAMLLGGGRFIWGFDNAAPLYRVRLEDAGATVRFLTEPKDVLHWPAMGQTVEIIPWGAVIDNGEKLAEEATPGHFALVEDAYDPDQRTISLTAATAVSPAFGTEWQSRADAAELQHTRYGLEGPVPPYYFLRVWDRGPEVTAEPTLPLVPMPAALGTTGLRLQVDGADQRPGDHCIIAARPGVPDRVLPWELLVGRAPHGIEHFIAPLALLRWQDGNGEVIHDCRPRFRPLTRIRNCCTYTVGDGKQSQGDFDRIQAAVDALPPDGGEVCVLPGIYEGRVVLDKLENIKISGCGDRSLIVPPDDGPQPLLEIRGGVDIRISNLSFAAAFGPAIVGNGEVINNRAEPIVDLRMNGLEVSGRDAGAIDVRLVAGLELLNSRIVIDELPADLLADQTSGRNPAVFLLGDDLTIAENRIEALGDTAIRRALGGLQIGGGSERVLIRDNLIQGGNGNGITLGHVFLADREIRREFGRNYAAAYLAAEFYFVGVSIFIDENGCVSIVPPGSERDPDDPEPERFPVSGGDLEDIEIRENRIANMALSGIASPIAFHGQLPVIASIIGLKIDGNTITGVATLEVPELPRRLRLYVAFGGICLYAVEIGAITGNHIEGAGRRHIEPICGIWLMSAETAVISANRLIDNGPRIETDQEPKPGARGGIMVLSAAPHPTSQGSATMINTLRRIKVGVAASRAVGLPALMVHDNVVQQPLGKALVLFGHGHMSISANHFASQGTTTRSLFEPLIEVLRNAEEMSTMELLYILIDRLLGSAVTVVNLGFSSELAEGMLLFDMLKTARQPIDQPTLKMEEAAGLSQGLSLPSQGWGGTSRLLRNGEVAFNDNAVVQSFLDGQRSFTLSAGLLVSLDDLSIADNSFSSQVDFIGDFSVANLLALGWSIRCTSNRLEETLLHSMFSAITLAMYNATVHNQGTHCFLIEGLPQLTTDAPNHSLVTAFNPFACGGCLRPPFDELKKVARGNNGQSVTPELRTVGGHSGMWFGNVIEIALGIQVDELSVGAVGNDIKLRIEAFGTGTVTRDLSLSGDQEQVIVLSGSNLSHLVISGGDERAIITRLCAERPTDPFGSGDFLGGNFVKLKV